VILGAFASLLQLGFGIGIGLSLFKTPLTIRAAKIGLHIDAQLSALHGVHTEVGKDQRGRLASLKLEFSDTEVTLNKIYHVLFIFVLIGVIAKLLLLISASVWPGARLNDKEMVLLLFVSVGYYLTLGALMELLTRFWLSPIQRKLKTLI